MPEPASPRYRFAATMAACLLTLPTLATDVPEVDLLRFELRDQYGESVVLPSPASPTTIDLVAVADRRGADANRDWARRLAERYGPHLEGHAHPTLRIVPVAHLRGVPRIARGIVRSVFRNRDDGERLLPIALDWKGEVASQVDFERGVPNMIVVGFDGRVLLHAAGPAGSEAEALVWRQLDLLLGHGRDPR